VADVQTVMRVGRDVETSVSQAHETRSIVSWSELHRRGCASDSAHCGVSFSAAESAHGFRRVGSISEPLDKHS